MTPTSANCDAPVNMRRESAHVWRTLRPAAVAIAPKLTPYAAVAMPTATPWETTWDRSRGVSGSSNGSTGDDMPEGYWPQECGPGSPVNRWWLRRIMPAANTEPAAPRRNPVSREYGTAGTSPVHRPMTKPVTTTAAASQIR
jgi:hypothetical protein